MRIKTIRIILLCFTCTLFFTSCEKDESDQTVVTSSSTTYDANEDFKGGTPYNAAYDPKALQLQAAFTIGDMPPYVSQGATNACGSMAAGIAHGKYVKNRWFPAQAGWPDWLRRSPWYTWRAINPTDAPFQLNSTFWYMSTVLNSLQNNGCCALQAKPANNGPNDANQNNLAAQRRIGSWSYIVNASNVAQPIDNRTLTNIKALIGIGRPVILRIGMQTDANFQNPTIQLLPGGVWNYTAGNRGPYMHYVCVYGYDDATQRLLCRNSWAGWGLNGQSDFYMTYATFLYMGSAAGFINT